MDVERTEAHEPVYIHKGIIKPNLVCDSYMRHLTPIQFPSPKGYHGFDYALYSPLEQSFVETFYIQLVIMSGQDENFPDSALPCITILHSKEIHLLVGFSCPSAMVVLHDIM